MTISDYRLFFEKAKMAIKLLRAIPRQVVTSEYGVKLRRNLKDRDFRWAMTRRYGDYIFNIIKNKNTDFVFLDIGANMGLYSLVAANNRFCRGVFSFEPNFRTFRYLVENIEINDAQMIKPFCAAISGLGAEIVKLTYDETHSGRSQVDDESRSGVAHASLFAISLNHCVLNRIEREISERVLCKIDVEGSELAVLKELERSNLLGRIDQFIVEMNMKTSGKEGLLDIEKLLNRMGFEEKSRSGDDLQYDSLFCRN